ncbi:hypothetical protein GOODEAATRI_024259 [Goodea atripinnis]|uniref:Secreted protein n=1 Tax=Goodea atripinnis TaxID=208336 RepID=A0ABV0N3Y9_9TELE
MLKYLLSIFLYSPGSLLVQCSPDGSPYYGRLCVPKLGSGSRLVNGPILHDSYSRLYGLHVPHSQRHLQRGKMLSSYVDFTKFFLYCILYVFKNKYVAKNPKGNQ